MSKVKNVVVIGGGTGMYTILSGLKKYPIDLSVIVSMMDSGGSNRVIRDEFGLLPTSDIRQCIVALASNKSHEMFRELFTYRYNRGTGITGMTFGNLFMAAITDIHKSQEEAIRRTCDLLDVQGKVVPITYEETHLVARYDDGHQVLGEHNIDEPSKEHSDRRIVELEVFPPVKANPKALQLIKQADLIVLGPGDLYTSIICNLVINEVAATIAKSKAKKVYVMNLMTRYGQTTNFKASDHFYELEKYLGKGNIDICLVNKTKKYPKGVLVRYKEENAKPVEDDLNNSGVKVVRRSLVSNKIFEKEKGDKLTRSLIRHDPKKLARVIMTLLGKDIR
jgi:uncharacterized cofD-like protein